MKLPPETDRWIRDDLDRRAVRNGCRFSEESGRHVVEFFKQLRHTKGRWAGDPFELLPWQEDAVMRLFGWMDADGDRRYRLAYIEIPKKNGKSALCSGLALYLLAGDGEQGAEVYIAASDRDQAGIVYREASAMARGSPLLKDYIRPSDSVKNLALPSTHSFLRAISRESTTAEGLNIHGLIFDELHAQKARDLWDTLRYGGASRRQPLLVSITTAGWDRNSICYEQHEYAERVRDGIIEDDSFFGLIYAADKEDDWTDPEVWKAANPSFGATFQEKMFRQDFEEARQSPVKENSFKRYRLNIWTEQATRWIQMDRWDACDGAVDTDSLIKRTCYAGLDLASTTDTASLVLFFPDTGDVLPFFWVPAENAKRRSERDRVPYLTWARQKHIELTPGDSIDYRFIRKRVNELAALYKIEEIAFDPWNATQLATQLSEEDGFMMVQFRQGTVSMNEPLKRLESLLMEGNIRHGGHPVLRWMAANVTVREDPSANIRVDKQASYERVDGIVALAMAIGRAMVQTDKRSVYETRGILQL